MNLTDHQWRLLQSLFQDHTPPSSRGRPPHNPRPILDGILWKIRHATPWEKLPPGYPSHMTCYRRYRLWSRDGRLNQVFLTLYKDLLHRGHFDLMRAIKVGDITILPDGDQFRILVAAVLIETWQLSTALVFVQLALNRLKQIDTRTLTN